MVHRGTALSRVKRSDLQLSRKARRMPDLQSIQEVGEKLVLKLIHKRSKTEISFTINQKVTHSSGLYLNY